MMVIGALEALGKGGSWPAPRYEFRLSVNPCTTGGQAATMPTNLSKEHHFLTLGALHPSPCKPFHL